MTFTDQVKATVQAPSTLPVWISNATITAQYATTAVAAGDHLERVETLAEIVPDIEMLINAGFLARPIGSIQPVTVSSSQTGNNAVTLQVVGSLHVSVLTVLTRLLVNLHEVPGNADLEVGLPPLRYVETIRALHISCTAAPNSPGQTQSHLLDPVSEDALPHPQVINAGGVPLTPILEVDRLVVSNVASLPSDIENAFLMLCDSGCFLPLGVLTDFDPGEAEIFVAQGELVIERMPIQPSFLTEFIGMLTGGNPAQTTVMLPS